MTLYIIVPVFNRAQKTRDYLDRLSRQTVRDFEVIVVNDGSTDSTHEVLQSFNEILHITELKTENLWWGGSINYGLRWLWENHHPPKGTLVALANNDTFIADDFVEKMIDSVNTGEIGFFHPRVLDENKRSVSCGARLFSWFPYLTRHPKFNPVKVEDSVFYPVDFLTARFLIAKAEVFEKVGLIPDGMPHYQGDYYLSYKARTLGMKNYVVLGALLTVDNSDTGLKSDNLVTVSDLKQSFRSIRSSNNLEHRFAFISAFIKNRMLARLVLYSMILNILGKFALRRTLFLFK